MSKPVVIQVSKNGPEYGFETAAQALKAYPDGKIVRHQDGTAFEEPKPKADAKKDDVK